MGYARIPKGGFCMGYACMAKGGLYTGYARMARWGFCMGYARMPQGRKISKGPGCARGSVRARLVRARGTAQRGPVKNTGGGARAWLGEGQARQGQDTAGAERSRLVRARLVRARITHATQKARQIVPGDSVTESYTFV